MTHDIRRLSGAELERASPALGAVLVDAVASGGGVSFMHPLAADVAQAFFADLVPEVTAGRILFLAAFVGDAVAGSVQVVPAWQPNQPHRVDLAKMIVHRAFRGRGIGGALLDRAEVEARGLGRSLMTLDTVTGGPGHRLYLRHGFTDVGNIPGYALGPFGTPESATFMYKPLV